MVELSDLNSIAQIVIKCFQDAGFGEAYIYDKMEYLSKKDKYQTLFWCTHQLDSNNKLRFAKKIGVSIDELVITFDTVRKIEFT